MDFPEKYDFKKTEEKWQKYWQDKGVYQWKDDKPREETFVIDTPPPTVSGILHMGHVYSYTQADFIARYQRMSGKDVFYPMGFDDNGLPTERLVEKVKKVRPNDLGREKFIEVCQEVVADAEKEFEALFNSIALSVDWRQKYETISAQSRTISQSSFLDLYNRANPEVYRKLKPMFWDPVDQTAIAQAEIVDKEMESAENYLWFGIDGSAEKIEIMTTRPEMLAACVAVMVHPDNKDYIGKTAITPLFNVKVPIIADEKVDKEKGTGFVMCCTFGDETDIKWWEKNPHLATRIVLDKFGKIRFGSLPPLPFNPNLHGGLANHISFLNTSIEGRATNAEALIGSITPANSLDFKQAVESAHAIMGKKVKEARDIIVSLLQENNLLAKESVKIKHVVKTAERSGASLEIIPSEQWFIKIVDKKEALKEKINQCKWHPEYMKVRAEQWTDSLSWDWCISRQRYFGVPFPVWYLARPTPEGRSYSSQDIPNPIIVASPSQLPVDPLVDIPSGYELIEDRMKTHGDKIVKNKANNEAYTIVPDFDVMDTWATSSSSPMLNSHAWVNPERHKKLFPADLRPQAHEIIRTWAFYTIVKAHLHENTIPWKNLMISGWCLAEDKSKMSKSKGNVITPVPLIESKSSDVVRYWTSTSNLGADTAYSEEVLKIGNKLVNKLWNASKFASINLSKLKDSSLRGAEGDAAISGDRHAAKAARDDMSMITETLDKWIITRLNKTIRKATEEFEQFEYCRARVAIEDFFWNDFCDNYLEMAKTRSYDEAGANPQGQQSALKAIQICIENILKLWAPFVPHITEELNSIIFGGESIHARGSWPKANLPEDETAEKAGIDAITVVEAVRKFKSEKAVSVKFPVSKLTISGYDNLKSAAEDIKSVTSSETVEFTSGEPKVSVELGEQKAA